MLDRESTFADPAILELLKTKFIPVALDQWYSRRQQDTEGEFYRRIAGQGPRNDFNNTTQGLYIADAAGTLIAFNNNRGPERIRALLEKAVAEYDSPDATPIVREKTDPRFAPRLPDGAVAVRTNAKVLSGYESTDDHWQQIFQSAVSRDNLWITAEEQQQLAQGQMPHELGLRIARFHLVDDTRGEPPRWSKNEVHQFDVELNDGTISGKFRLESEDHSRGFEGTIRGVLAVESGKLTQFELLAEGSFWGTGSFTMQPPAGKFPLAIAFRLADGSDIADGIPPHASRGWVEGYWHPER